MGHQELKRALYFPAMVAGRHNPLVATFWTRLKAQGKPGKVIVVACMHKLLAIAFFVGAIVFALVPICRDSTLLAVLAFTFGLSLGCTQTLTLMLMFSSAEEGRSGATVGLRLTVNKVARLLGPAVFGAVGALSMSKVSIFWPVALPCLVRKHGNARPRPALPSSCAPAARTAWRRSATWPTPRPCRRWPIGRCRPGAGPTW